MNPYLAFALYTLALLVCGFGIAWSLLIAKAIRYQAMQEVADDMARVETKAALKL